MADYIFNVPEQYAGKTLSNLKDLPNGLEYVPEQRLWDTPYDSPLTAGQNLKFSTTEDISGNAGYLSAQRLFGAPLSQAQIAEKAQKQALSARQQAIQPAVKSLEASLPEQAQKFQTERTRLESEKDPLKQRYQLVLDELKRRESRDVGDINLSLAREFGRRGIPLSSGLYEETGIEKRRPASEFYGIQGREAGATYEEGSRNITNLLNQLVPQETEANRVIRNAIAQLQAGAGTGAIEDAFRQLKFMEEQRQFNKGNILQKAQQQLAERELEQYKIPSLKKTETTDPYKQFLKLGEGETIFDLSKLQKIFSTPKTYKPTGSGADTGGW